MSLGYCEQIILNSREDAVNVNNLWLFLSKISIATKNIKHKIWELFHMANCAIFFIILLLDSKAKRHTQSLNMYNLSFIMKCEEVAVGAVDKCKLANYFDCLLCSRMREHRNFIDSIDWPLLYTHTHSLTTHSVTLRDRFYLLYSITHHKQYR